MDKFSNINWTAFLFGCLKSDKYSLLTAWVYWYGVVLAIKWAVVSFLDIVTPVFILGFYIPLAIASVYFALQGNRLLLRKIEAQELSPEKEEEERMMVAARQKKFIQLGILMRLIQYGFFAVLPGRVFLAAGQPTDFSMIFQIVAAMVIIDIAAVMVTLVIAYLRGDKESELYSDEIPDDIMTNVSNKRGFSILGD